MAIKVVVHEAEEGGYWAEVRGIPGCATEGETMDDLVRNLREAIEGCLSTRPTKGLKALLAAAPLEGVAIKRARDRGRKIDI